MTDARYFNVGVIRGHRQISDIYLLGLAKKMGGYLATFDSGIPIGAVIGATRNTLAVISPDMPRGFRNSLPTETSAKSGQPVPQADRFPVDSWRIPPTKWARSLIMPPSC